jgi:hypothetical protein
LLGLTLTGCEDLGKVAVDEARGRDGQPAHASEERNDVIVYNTYLAAGDQLTYVAGGQQSFPLGPHGSSQSGMSGRPDVLPRANATLSVDGTHGTAFLYWEGKVVEEFEFDLAFFLSGEVEALSYQAPDGTIAELHVYGRPDFQQGPQEVSTRAEIEALEH